MYPDLLPSKARGVLREGTAPITKVQAKFLLSSVSVGSSAPLHSADENTLIHWAAWSHNRARFHPYDPRVGEWTALEIARQALILLRNSGRSVEAVHPQNFRVPDEWLDEGNILTWEAWRSKIAKHPLKFTPGAKIKDIRWWTGAHSTLAEKEMDKVAAMAVLLLGLLSRDFRWPATWNSGGQMLARSGLVRSILARVACSSWTAAILEGCLLPRQRETALWPLVFQHQFGVDDTAEDPPEFTDLTHLEKGFEKAEEVLAGYQISVQNHQPRQMVPISLTQLTRKFWATDTQDVGGS